MDGSGFDPVAVADAAIASVEALQEVRFSALTPVQLRAVTDRVLALSARAEAVRLGVVRAVDARPEVVPQARASQAAVELLLARRVSPRQASLDVRVARAIDPDTGSLRLLGAAFAAGLVWRGHLDVATRALDRIPRRMLTKVAPDGLTGAQRLDACVTEQALRFPPSDLAVLVQYLLDVLDPDGGDRRDAEAFARRRCHAGFDATGMLHGTFDLDPAAGLLFTTVMSRYGAPLPVTTAVTPEGELVEHRDTRDQGQRQADVLTDMCRTYLTHHAGGQPAHTSPAHAQSAHTQSGRSSADADLAPVDDAASAPKSGPTGQAARPAAEPAPDPVAEGWARGVPAGRVPALILLTATTGQLADDPLAGRATSDLAGPVSRHTLRRLSCDAVFQRVLHAPSGAVLNLGRAVRLATPTQRRAITARDGQCLIPGCRVPVTRCDLHHVQHWADGGLTDLTNLAPLCGRHHSAVHAGEWAITFHDGLPWVIPPPWVDPQRRPVRKPRTDAVQTMLRTGQAIHDGTQDGTHDPSGIPARDPGGGSVQPAA